MTCILYVQELNLNGLVLAVIRLCKQQRLFVCLNTAIMHGFANKRLADAEAVSRLASLAERVYGAYPVGEITFASSSTIFLRCCPLKLLFAWFTSGRPLMLHRN